MYDDFATLDGSRLVWEDEMFIMGIYGEKGGASIFNDEYTKGESLFLFHLDTPTYSTSTFFRVEELDLPVLLVFCGDKSGYLYYDEEEDKVLFTEEMPDDPIYIEPVEEDVKYKEDDPVFFFLRTKKNKLKFESGGRYLNLFTTDSQESSVVYFLTKQ